MRQQQGRSRQSSNRSGVERRSHSAPPIYEYPAPADTQEVYRQYAGRCQNPGLLYERFIGYQKGWGLEADSRARQHPKKEAIEAVIEAQRRLSDSLQLWEGLKGRWMQIIGDALVFTANPEWRFVTGLGRESPLEVGFTFHRIYGFPILPGSSVKGVARAWGLVTIAESLGVDQLDTLNKILTKDDPQGFEQEWQDKYAGKAKTVADRFRRIFGTTGAAGSAVFFDAIPADPPTLKLDVMNPHYPKYYQGTQPPADWQSPQPIFFLTVGKESRFLFAVGWRGMPNQDVQEQAKRWLMDGLTKLGAGAKTSAGYGYFKEVTL